MINLIYSCDYSLLEACCSRLLALLDSIHFIFALRGYFGVWGQVQKLFWDLTMYTIVTAQFSLDRGDKVIGLNHPPTTTNS